MQKQRIVQERFDENRAFEYVDAGETEQAVRWQTATPAAGTGTVGAYVEARLSEQIAFTAPDKSGRDWGWRPDRPSTPSVKKPALSAVNDSCPSRIDVFVPSSAIPGNTEPARSASTSPVSSSHSAPTDFDVSANTVLS